jgi:hypothetical protein
MKHTEDQLDRATRILEVGRYNRSLTSRALAELVAPELQCEFPAGALSIACPECQAAPGAKCLTSKDHSWTGLSYMSTVHPARTERANGMAKEAVK